MITDNIAAIQAQYGTYRPTLIAVSKQQPDEKIEEALAAGLRVFGENRLQEAQRRWTHRRAAYPDLQLHFIGHLQNNKVKDVCALFDVIHTLDRPKLAYAIAKYAPAMPCFIQVNVGDEDQKSGIAKGNLDPFYEECRALGLNIIGLMGIPPVHEDPALHFQWLKDAANTLGLPSLSMGMSDDFPAALAHGATHIRIGSRLFGKRF